MPLGLTGATAATRYVGATTSGAPASGTFAVGDFVITQDGSVYVCTAAGTPGTWTQLGGSSTLINGKLSGAYYTTHLAGATGWITGVSQNAGIMTCVPIFLPAGTLVRIAQQHFANTPAGETLRMGIYNDNGSGLPGTLLLDAGSIDLSTATGVKEITISQAVATGVYWLASVKQGSNTATVLVNTFNGVARTIAPTKGPSGTNLYDTSPGFSLAGVTGALPDPFTGTATLASNVPIAPPLVRYS
jgi:hypothetical protein